MSLALLKQQLARILDVDRAAPPSPGLATGLAALDRGLPGGGIPRGRLTEVRGALGSGKTTLVRRVAERAVAAGLQVAYVDAARTLAPRDWAHLARGGADAPGLWVVRPTDAARGAWCADVLLRSGAFGLVVLDGAPPLPRGVAVRLTRLAREGDAALVVVADGGGGCGGGVVGAWSGAASHVVGGAVRLRVEARPRRSLPAAAAGGEQQRHQQHQQHQRWRRRHRRGFVVAVEKGGVHQTVEVGCAIAVARRLCAHPEVPDRRGVERGERGARGGGGRGGRGAAGAPDSGADRLTA